MSPLLELELGTGSGGSAIDIREDMRLGYNAKSSSISGGCGGISCAAGIPPSLSAALLFCDGESARAVIAVDKGRRGLPLADFRAT